MKDISILNCCAETVPFLAGEKLRPGRTRVRAPRREFGGCGQPRERVVARNIAFSATPRSNLAVGSAPERGLSILNDAPVDFLRASNHSDQHQRSKSEQAITRRKRFYDFHISQCLTAATTPRLPPINTGSKLATPLELI